MWQRTSVCVWVYILSGVDEGQVWPDERMNSRCAGWVWKSDDWRRQESLQGSGQQVEKRCRQRADEFIF